MSRLPCVPTIARPSMISAIRFVGKAPPLDRAICVRSAGGVRRVLALGPSPRPLMPWQGMHEISYSTIPRWWSFGPALPAPSMIPKNRRSALTLQTFLSRLVGLNRRYTIALPDNLPDGVGNLRPCRCRQRRCGRRNHERKPDVPILEPVLGNKLLVDFEMLSKLHVHGICDEDSQFMLIQINNVRSRTLI